MKTMPRVVVLGSIVALMSFAALAGPLSPPVGPVGGTNKTLGEMEPRIAVNSANTPGNANCVFRIAQPGSYYLTGNIVVPAGMNGVTISAADVTLDLRGFEISSSSATSLSGVNLDNASAMGVEVRNGSVRGCGGHGVDISISPGGRVVDVRAQGNTSAGIRVGNASMVMNCLAVGNGTGITAGFGATLTNCAADRNTSHGFSLSQAATVTGCTAYDNDGAGFTNNGRGTFNGCTATSNATGYSLGFSSVATACLAADNDNGFNSAGGASFTSCVAYNNSGFGFDIGSGSAITKCVARSSVADGIVSGNGSIIHDNVVTLGGSHGIRVTGTANRIDGNLVYDCLGTGVNITGAENIIIRNMTKGNGTNMVFAANNIHGPVTNRRIPESVPSTAAYNSTTTPSASSTYGSTDPTANVIF